VVAGLVRILALTWRVRYAGRDRLLGLRAEGRPFVFVLWHEHLLPLLWTHRGHPTTLLVSEHADGRLLAGVARRWGFRIVDGSSSRGGVRALRKGIRVLRDGGELAVTPDGPRGPRHLAKPGATFAAAAAGVPLLPVRVRVGSCWRLRSWDRFAIPRPFTTVTVTYGAAVHAGCDPHATARAVETSLSVQPGC